jgi:uncharacterized protein with von Willebrand factor type A (vWA) domain
MLRDIVEAGAHVKLFCLQKKPTVFVQQLAHRSGGSYWVEVVGPKGQ